MNDLAAASAKASRLPPQSLVDQWITVEGKGLGRVLSFNKNWAPGTDSFRKYFFQWCCKTI